MDCDNLQVLNGKQSFQLPIIWDFLNKIQVVKKMKYFGLCRQLKKVLQPFSTNKIIHKHHDSVICDFRLINSPSASIECVIVQNNPLNLKLFSKCLPLAENIVLADGGANHFYETQFRDSQKIRSIVGDFDCIQDDVLRYYQDKGIPIEYTSNQQTNDFNKAIEYCVENSWNQLFCFGSFGGRMDKTLSSMHLTTKFGQIEPQLQIVLLGKTNVMYYLRKNINYQIKISEEDFNKHGCGLITFGKVDHVETEGLRWNLGKKHSYHSMQWGQFISICNEMVDCECKVRSSDDIFFVTRYSPEMSL